MTARVFAIAQQKGGVGKTTLAAQLAVAWSRNGRRVALLDTDPQGSLAAWFAARQKTLNGSDDGRLTVAPIGGWRTAAEVERAAAANDVVLIDCPPHAETDARVAMRAADLVLVPVQPSPPDVWAAEGTLALAGSERRVARVVLNRMPPASKLGETVKADLTARGLPLLRSAIGNRTGFATAFAAGLGVTEAAPRSSAAAELRALLEELREIAE